MEAATEAAQGLRRAPAAAAGAGPEAEKRRQLWFTVGAALASSLMLFSTTYETRWISTYLGKAQFEAYSVAHSAIFYLGPLRNLWSGVTSKVARAVGQKDDVAVSKLIKQCGYVTGLAFALTWLFYGPFGPWLLRTVYQADDDIYPYALPYLRARTLGEGSVQYFQEAGVGIIQGLQGLKLYLGVQVWTALFSVVGEWFVIVLMQWDLVWDGIIRIFREGMGMVFCMVWAWWFVNRVPGNKHRFTPRAAKLERADWTAFLGVR